MKDQILARMYVVLTLVSLVPLCIVGQIAWIYLTQGNDLREQGQQQASSSIKIPAMRGTIVDRAGRTLAVNTARYDLALDPTVPGFEQKKDAFFDKLSRLTGRSAAWFRREVATRASRQYVLLLRGLTERQKEAVEAWDVPGLLLKPLFARRYNYGTTAAHILGYVSSDGHGLAGLELRQDEVLHGVAGRRAVKRDRRGIIKVFVGGSVVEPEHGETLVLTIDLVRQAIMEEELARGVEESGAAWGTAIAVDPRTGAVLAMANVPTYDPNQPGRSPVGARRNRAITDRIEPGSTFKLVPAVAALEQGVVTLEDSIETGDGWAVFHGRTVNDTHAWGTITFAEAIIKSSNVALAKVAEKIDPGVFYQYARNLGFGQPTWIDLPGEVAGTLRKPSEWSGSTLTSMSRGYGVDATPLQVLMAYAALANGGLLVQPYVVAERRDVTGRTLWTAPQDSVRRAFKRSTAELLLPVFEDVVEEGTATRAQVDGLRIAGKTGTAQKIIDGAYQPGKYRASFVGFFPADDPKVAMIVVLDEPRTSGYGGVVAAPIFKRIAERWAAALPEVARRIAPAPEQQPAPDRPVPDVTGQPEAVATARLIAAGYRVAPADPDERLLPVAEQHPGPGTPLVPGARVRLTAHAPDSTALRMPDLTGLSTRQAVFWLRARGAEVEVQGSGVTVTGQSAPAGAALPEHVVLRCR